MKLFFASDAIKIDFERKLACISTIHLDNSTINDY